MELGPTIIKTCSECSGWIEEDTIVSGNTFGAIFFTDGKMDAPMLPDKPLLVKCPHCQAFIWIDEQEKAGEVKPFSDSGVYKDAKSYNAPELHDYFSKLKISNLSRKKEQYLRLRAWWAGNDKRRYANLKHSLSDEERENLQSLYEMLNTSDDNDRIMKAEIKRELGQFEDAEAILRAPFGNEFSQAVSIIRELIQQRDPFVAEMKFEK
jgi:hypothetical protein